jgi:hypothetical protein
MFLLIVQGDYAGNVPKAMPGLKYRTRPLCKQGNAVVLSPVARRTHSAIILSKRILSKRTIRL